jgi:hypothetical protein
MSQAKVLDGDLYIIFKDVESDVLISHRLDNGAEFDFYEDEISLDSRFYTGYPNNWCCRRIAGCRRAGS